MSLKNKTISIKEIIQIGEEYFADMLYSYPASMLFNTVSDGNFEKIFNDIKSVVCESDVILRNFKNEDDLIPFEKYNDDTHDLFYNYITCEFILMNSSKVNKSKLDNLKENKFRTYVYNKAQKYFIELLTLNIENEDFYRNDYDIDQNSLLNRVICDFLEGICLSYYRCSTYNLTNPINYDENNRSSLSKVLQDVINLMDGAGLLELCYADHFFNSIASYLSDISVISDLLIYCDNIQKTIDILSKIRNFCFTNRFQSITDTYLNVISIFNVNNSEEQIINGVKCISIKTLEEPNILLYYVVTKYRFDILYMYLKYRIIDNARVRKKDAYIRHIIDMISYEFKFPYFDGIEYDGSWAKIECDRYLSKLSSIEELNNISKKYNIIFNNTNIMYIKKLFENDMFRDIFFNIFFRRHSVEIGINRGRLNSSNTKIKVSYIFTFIALYFDGDIEKFINSKTYKNLILEMDNRPYTSDAVYCNFAYSFVSNPYNLPNAVIPEEINNIILKIKNNQFDKTIVEHLRMLSFLLMGDNAYDNIMHKFETLGSRYTFKSNLRQDGMSSIKNIGDILSCSVKKYPQLLELLKELYERNFNNEINLIKEILEPSFYYPIVSSFAPKRSIGDYREYGMLPDREFLLTPFHFICDLYFYYSDLSKYLNMKSQIKDEYTEYFSGKILNCRVKTQYNDGITIAEHNSFEKLISYCCEIYKCLTSEKEKTLLRSKERNFKLLYRYFSKDEVINLLKKFFEEFIIPLVINAEYIETEIKNINSYVKEVTKIGNYYYYMTEACKDKVSDVEDLLLNTSRYNFVVSFLNCLNSNGIYFNEEVQNFPKQFREKVQQEKTYLDFVWSTKF